MTTGIFNGIQTAYPPKQQAVIAQQTTKPNEEILVKDAVAAHKVGDTYESSAVTVNKGKGLKGFIARVKSAFATFGEYTKGTFKGVTSGVVAGSVVYTAASAINFIRNKAAEKAGTVAKKLPNKFLAGAAALAALGINLWNASLNANEKRSEIHHRWIGH